MPTHPFHPLRFKKLALSCFIGMLAWTFFGLGESLRAQDSDAAPWPMTPRGEEPDERVIWGVLSNGLRYAIVPASPSERIVSMRLVVDAGLAHDPVGKAGTGQLLERLAYSGTRAVDGESLYRLLQRNGMGDVRFRGVGLRHTVFRLDLDHCVKEDFDTALAFLADLGDGLIFDDATLEAEKAGLVRDLRDGVATLRGDEIREDQLMFEDSPSLAAANRPSAHTVAAISREDVETHWNAWYRPERMTLFIVGNVSPENVEQAIEERLGDLVGRGSAPSAPPRQPSKIRSPGGVVTVPLDEPRSQVVAASVSRRPIDFYDPDAERELYWMDALGRYAQAKLDGRQDVDTKGLTVHAGRTLAHMGTRGSLLQLEDQVRSVDMQVHRFAEQGISTEELQSLKQSLARRRQVRAADIGQREWPPIVADRLASCYMERRPFRYGERHAAYHDRALEQLDLATANRLLRERYGPQGAALVIWIPGEIKLSAKQITKRLKQMRKGYTFVWGDRQRYNSSWKVKSGIQEIGMVTASNPFEIGRHQAIRYTLQNRLRLNVARTDNAPGSFRMRLSFGNGLTDLKDPFPGASLLADSVLRRMRISHQTAAPSLYETLGSQGLSGLEAGAGAGQFYLGAAGSSEEQLYAFLSLTTEWILSGRFSEDDFKKVIEDMGKLASSSSNPTALAAIDAALFGQDERLRLNFTKEELDAVSYESVLAWIDEARKNGYLELTIVGDVEPRSVLRDVRKTLGALPTREGKVVQPRHGSPARLPEPGLRSVNYSSSSDRAYASLLWPIAGGDGCGTEVQSKALRALLERRYRSILKTSGNEDIVITTYLTGYDMIPGSRALRVDLVAPQARLESLQEEVLALAQNLSEQLDPLTLGAVERSERLALIRSDLYDGALAALLDQSQGKPSTFDCNRRLMQGAAETTLEGYRALARATFSRDNVRGVSALPSR